MSAGRSQSRLDTLYINSGKYQTVGKRCVIFADLLERFYSITTVDEFSFTLMLVLSLSLFIYLFIFCYDLI